MRLTPLGPMSSPRAGRPRASAQAWDAGAKWQSRPLTERQIEALNWLCHGLQQKQIAVRMGVSLSTAHNHLTTAMLKLKTLNRADTIITWLERKGLPNVQSETSYAVEGPSLAHAKRDALAPDCDPRSAIWTRSYTWFRLEERQRGA